VEAAPGLSCFRDGFEAFFLTVAFGDDAILDESDLDLRATARASPRIRLMPRINFSFTAQF
jgi:hypothetical protein